MAKVYSTVSRQKIRLPLMGPQGPKDVARDTARDLSALVGELCGRCGRGSSVADRPAGHHLGGQWGLRGGTFG